MDHADLEHADAGWTYHGRRGLAARCPRCLDILERTSERSLVRAINKHIGEHVAAGDAVYDETGNGPYWKPLPATAAPETTDGFAHNVIPGPSEGWEPTPEDPSILWTESNSRGEYATLTCDRTLATSADYDVPHRHDEWCWTVYDSHGLEIGCGRSADRQKAERDASKLLTCGARL